MMFRRLRQPEKEVTIFVDGRPVQASEGESIAAAMLANGVTEFHLSAVSQRLRAPYCMIGNCFECVVEIDGLPNQQACLVRVTKGMHVRRQMSEQTQ